MSERESVDSNILDKKRKWPWNAELKRLSISLEKQVIWPKISIVTPSYNQGEFLEETIRSVLLQNYPNLEYIIIDGGSSDNSIEIIKEYEKYIDYWVSEPDKGQSDAINKGFKIATGKYGNWINSDDLLAKDALLNAAKFLQNANSNTLFLGQCIITNKDRTQEYLSTSTIKSVDNLIDIKNYWRKGNSIAQQNVLFDLQEFKKVGGLNVHNHYAMDYELWGDLLLAGNRIHKLNFPIGIFRQYEGQKISDKLKTTHCLIRSARGFVRKNNSWSMLKKIKTWFSLLQFEIRYTYKYFRSWLNIKERIRKII
jgi:glycosyltransferase involved in cell wall biosynthesis